MEIHALGESEFRDALRSRAAVPDEVLQHPELMSLIYVSYYRDADGYRVYMDEISGFSATGRTIEEARRRMVELMARTIEQGREECHQRMKAQRVEIIEDITEYVEELIHRLGTDSVHEFDDDGEAQWELRRADRKPGH